MARVLRAPATLQRDRTSSTETGESREVDIEVDVGRVVITLRPSSWANAQCVGLRGDSMTGGGQVVGPFHRLDLDEADLRRVLGVGN